VELVPDPENGSSAPAHGGGYGDGGAALAHGRRRTDGEQTLEGGPPVGLKPSLLETSW